MWGGGEGGRRGGARGACGAGRAPGLPGVSPPRAPPPGLAGNERASSPSGPWRELWRVRLTLYPADLVKDAHFELKNGSRDIQVRLDLGPKKETRRQNINELL